MELNQPGEACVLDLSELSRNFLAEIRFQDDKVANTPEKRFKASQKIDELVCQMVDDYINTQLYWTKCHTNNAAFISSNREKYLDALHELTDVTGEIRELLTNVEDKIAQQILDVIDLPTWNIVHVRYRRSLVHIELGEDYRIREWMKENARDFGFEESTHGW